MFVKIIIHLIIFFRKQKGKEDPTRIRERFGMASDFALRKYQKYKQFCETNNLPINVIWIHAVSVGESLSVLNFVKKMSEKNYFIVFTTTTITSFEMIKNKLPEHSVHQYNAFQIKSYLNKFLDIWNPKMVFFVENEIFPTTITVLHKRKIPFYLLNARLSDKSYKRWNLVKIYIKYLLKKYSCIFTLSDREQKKFELLSDNEANIKSFGNLKFDAAILNKNLIEENFAKKVNTVKYDFLREKFINYKVIVFGSIHAEEFSHILQHYSLIKDKVNCIGIFVPRYLNECILLEKKALEFGLNSVYLDDFFCKKELKKEDLTKKEDLIIVNRMGVLPYLYKICDIAVICGSYANGIGGHNPLESVVFGKLTFIGKYCCKSQDLVNELLDNGLVIQENNLSHAVLALKLIDDGFFLKKQSEFKEKADFFFQRHANVFEKIINELGI